MDLNRYSYNGKFDGNILVLGQTDCGETTFELKNELFNRQYKRLKQRNLIF